MREIINQHFTSLTVEDIDFNHSKVTLPIGAIWEKEKYILVYLYDNYNFIQPGLMGRLVDNTKDIKQVLINVLKEDAKLYLFDSTKELIQWLNK